MDVRRTTVSQHTVSTVESVLPQGLRDPPAYSPPPSPRPGYATLATPTLDHDLPPSYTPNGIHQPLHDSKPPREQTLAEDVLHFIHPEETLQSISLLYNVPIAALRRTNGLFSDNLFAARRTILIPGEFYKGGVSLSPRPVEGEEEEIKKSKIRKWMVTCKVAE
ncbi:hypothetical protein MMC25_002198 [Agyrium rufum]|nr:hypothetical protein [Agyrium rufum]